MQTSIEMMKNGLDIENWDIPIYRIYSMKRFEDMLLNKKNGLVKPSKWDDPFENFFLKNPAEDETLVSLESLLNSWYGQCWTTNKDSDAMWRIYSNDKTGIRVETTIGNLFSSLYDKGDDSSRLKYLIGKVEYISRSEIEDFLTKTTFYDLAFGGQPHEFAKTLCKKRNEFSHESEIRLLFQDIEGNVGVNGVAHFNLDPNLVFSEVALDPRLDDACFQVEKSKLIKLGCNIPIIQSDIYKFTPVTIKLGG